MGSNSTILIDLIDNEENLINLLVQEKEFFDFIIAVKLSSYEQLGRLVIFLKEKILTI